MCAVIGVCLKEVGRRDLEMVRSLFLQSMIRGKHATGLTFSKGGKLHTIKKPISAKEFVDRYNFEDFVDDGSLLLIGHARYSTSDLRHNQPFQNSDIAIAHNGVISQDPDLWEYETETANDSELILRCLEHKHHPLDVYKNRSMAVVVLREGGISAFRNHERPLWLANRKNGVLFCSTKNILQRSGITERVSQCEPLVEYSFGSDQTGLSVDRSHFDPNIQDLQP
jgi:glutamine phosphoribosylpyrophosphate amidotransferase